MFQQIYCDGKWAPWRMVSTDLGLWRADGAVEVLEARKNILFHWDDHFRRLVLACEGYYDLDLKKLPSEGELWSHVNQLLTKASLHHSILHIIVTPGNSDDFKKSEGHPQLIIDVRAMPPQNPPRSLMMVRAERYFPELKLTCGYGYARRFLADAKKLGYDGILYMNLVTGIAESAYQNIFFVRDDDVLITQKTGVLPGVTRKIVLEQASKSSIFKGVQEVDGIWFWQLDNFKEAFLTSTTLGVSEINLIGDPRSDVKKSFASFPDNPFTLALSKIFLDYRDKYFKSRRA